jgi:hypothetical protein
MVDLTYFNRWTLINYLIFLDFSARAALVRAFVRKYYKRLERALLGAYLSKRYIG